MTDLLHLPATLTLAHAASLLGIGRSTAYALVARDAFPCPTLRVSHTHRVPTPCRGTPPCQTRGLSSPLNTEIPQGIERS